jgi:hypothetical protein
LGVAIFDMDESEGELSTAEIVKQSGASGVNPGGAVSVQEVESIFDEHKNKLITDDELLLRLGSRGRKKPNWYAASKIGIEAFCRPSLPSILLDSRCRPANSVFATERMAHE